MAKTRRRKQRTHVQQHADPAAKKDPKSFVFWRGKHGHVLRPLEADLRRMMMPHTAAKLKESKRNTLKDFVHVAGPLGVTHFLLLTATENACYLRVAKTPRGWEAAQQKACFAAHDIVMGPTLTLKVHAYSLMKDVTASQRRPRLPESLWKTAPLMVMNNFGAEKHLKLATVLFQNMFPALNVQTVQLQHCQRVVLLSYDKQTRRISLRHYSISATPSGVSKGIKALVGQHAVPDMGDTQDVADFIMKGGYGSESEGEEAQEARVTLAQDMGRGNLAARQSRVRLQEVGPRLELEVVKVEEGLCSGRVLYHGWLAKPPAEAAAQEEAKQQQLGAEELRAKRRRQQEENVNRKEGERKRKAEAAAGAGGRPKKRKQQWWEVEQEGAQQRAAGQPDDDLETYRQTVGEEPGEDFGTGSAAADRGRRPGQRRGGQRLRGRGAGRATGRGAPKQTRRGADTTAKPGPSAPRGIIKHQGVRRKKFG